MHLISTTHSMPRARWLVSITLAMSLSACSSSSSMSTEQGASDNTGQNLTSETISVNATGIQQVPATGSLATAVGTLLLDTATHQLSGSVAVNGMSIDSAHIHSGVAGNNGAVIISLTVEGNTLTVPESTLLSDDEYNSLLAGGYYLNVHSGNFPDGEIRSQLLGDNIQVLVTALGAETEVPPVASDASGYAYITMNESTRSVQVTVRTQGIAQATAAHLHLGYAGSNGAPIFPLDQLIGIDGAFATTDAVVLSSENYLSLLAGETYVNVHSAQISSGELRGQVAPSGVDVLRAVLTGEQQVPAVQSAASGIAYVTVNANSGTALAHMSVTNLESTLAAHIHSGSIGENGSVILALSSLDSVNWTIPASSLDAAELNTLLNGGAYINVHSVAFPDGEIRGQLQ